MMPRVGCAVLIRCNEIEPLTPLKHGAPPPAALRIKKRRCASCSQYRLQFVHKDETDSRRQAPLPKISTDGRELKFLSTLFVPGFHRCARAPSQGYFERSESVA